MSTLFIPEAMNIFVGDDGPDNSKHQSVSTITLPKLEEKTQEHMAGGAVGAIEIGGLGLSPLVIGFKQAGWDPQSMAQFGIGGRAQIPYTMYGVIRDKATGDAVEVKAVARGRMVSLEKSEFKRGDLAEQTHEIKEVTHYELYWNKKELYWYDWKASQWRVNGVPQNSVENSILRIA